MSLPAIPWYRSPVLIGAVVSVISQLIVLGEPLGLRLNWTSEEITTGVSAVFQVIALAAAGFAAWKRYRSPAQPVTLTAAKAEERNESPDDQAGFARVSLLLTLCVVTIGGLVVSGCSGTRAAYRAADTPEAHAFVLTEHYAALVKQAADLAERPSTPAEVVRTLQRADRAAQPAIAALRPLRDAYLAASTAENQAALQAAVDRAVIAVADLVRAIRTAGGAP